MDLVYPFWKIFKNIPVLQPQNEFKVIFDFFLFAIIMLDLWYTPVNLSFNNGTISFFDEKLHNGVFFLEKVPVIVYHIDIIISINTAFFFKGVIVFEKLFILENYLKKYFLLDLISVIPFYVNLIFEVHSIEILVFFRLLKLKILIEKMKENLELSEKNQYFFQLIKLLFSILYVGHLCGCILHYISIWQINLGSNTTWLNELNLIEENWIVKYVNSVYYSVLTMITVGVPKTNSTVEKSFHIFINIVLSGTFAYSVSVIGIILQEMNKDNNELK